MSLAPQSLARPKPLFWPALPRHPRFWALGLGVISATGFQPLALWPLAMAAMGAFALLIGHSANWRQAALLGWIFGIGHFTLGNAWIAAAFTHQAKMPAVLGWGAVPLLALYLAAYPALAAGAARALVRNRGVPGWTMALALAGCWIIAEWLRGWVFTGYAWNPFAMVLLGPFDRPGLAVLAPWMGTYALSGAAVFFSAGFILLLRDRLFWGAGLAALALLAGMIWPSAQGAQGTVPATIVQPNLVQEQLSDRAYFEANYAKLARLSAPLRPGERRLVLWPESGMPAYLHDGYPQQFYQHSTPLGSPEFARARLARAIGEGSTLLTGAIELQIEDGHAIGAYNGVTALSDRGQIIGSYAKAHLVPYGEYLPLRPLLEPLGFSRLVPGAIDFLPGPGPQTINLGALDKAGVQICYEIIFSGEVVDAAHRPDYIYNPSNDGWFGSSGPPQHLAQARMRAVEEGLPVLRATVNGISAVIDSRGIVRASLPTGEMGRIDTMIPPALPPTLFARFQHLLTLFWAALLLCGMLVAMRKSAR